MNNTFLSFDTDWAPNYILSYTLGLLDKYSIKSTFFITNKLNIDLGHHEKGIHPDFTDSLNWESTFHKLITAYPEAIGMRSHSLTFSFKMFDFIKKSNIKYLSNYLCYNIPFTERLDLYSGIHEYPIWFIDNGYIDYFGDNTFDINNLNLKREHLRVFLFHPVHIYLNTENISRYYQAKEYINDQRKFDTFINHGIGIRKLFISFLESNTGKNLSISSQYV